MRKICYICRGKGHDDRMPRYPLMHEPMMYRSLLHPILAHREGRSLLAALTLCIVCSLPFVAQPVSIQQYGVMPGGDPTSNRDALQRAIDAASLTGAALYVEPCAEGYPLATGVRLRRNVSLIGVHGPTGRGTANADRTRPVGSLFVITDTLQPAFIVESATQIRGIQFWYPEQTFTTPEKIIAYKPTIQLAHDQSVEGVTLSCLTFYGEYMAMDFRAAGGNACEQILFEHCYGYPLSGEFIAIDKCYDIPRILHCHVNPSNMREFGRTFRRPVVDAVVARRTYAYYIDHTDNAQMMDVFTFGTWGGIYLGDETYGQLTNFNLDCVCIGIRKSGTQLKNRNWQIAQGSIIANCGGSLDEIHPLLVEGTGHVSFTNVECFSGENAALTTVGKCHDFLCVEGNGVLSVALVGCRMQGYTDQPINVHNPNAHIAMTACFDAAGEARSRSPLAGVIE